MIIRITVNDNDFTPALEKFAYKITYCDTLDVIKNPNEMSREINYTKKFTTLWHKMQDKSISELEKEELMNIITMRFNLFVKYYYPDSRKYLIDNFQIKIQKSLTPRDENGEVVYVFPNTDGQILTL